MFTYLFFVLIFQSPSSLTPSLSFTPQLGPGVYWFCTWCFYHGIALSYDIPPPIVLFWIIHLLINIAVSFLFLPPTLLM